jgi:ubiquinone/menaquinone biosynthesis C-methylase UbiE
MPKQQGVIHWPSKKNNSALLSDESKLPFGDNFFDKVILLHSLEFTDRTHPMLRDIWRVLAGGGKLMVIAPNRGGLWTRLERTPFGHGQPYSVQQLITLLQDTVFRPEKVASALYIPPGSGKLLQHLARPWEKIGRKYFRVFSGVIIVEAEKQVYSASTSRAETKIKTPGWRTVPGTT